MKNHLLLNLAFIICLHQHTIRTDDYRMTKAQQKMYTEKWEQFFARNPEPTSEPAHTKWYQKMMEEQKKITNDINKIPSQ